MLKNKKLLILTGGGETSVLNATIYGAIEAARKEGMKVYGGIKGWACLLENGKIVDLTDKNLKGVEDRGGTFLRTSRTNIFNIENGVSQLKESVKKHGIDYVLAIGGDDTLSCARRLHEEEGLSIIGAPKTADNDLNGVYFCPGFPSAAKKLITFVNTIRRDSAIPRDRLFVIESHGGSSGWLPSAAILANADFITIPEHKVDLDNFLQKVSEKYESKKNVVIVVSKESTFSETIGSKEEQNDSFNVKRTKNVAAGLVEVIKERLGIPGIALVPGNYVRGGRPESFDKEMALKIGANAVSLLKEKKLGHMSSVVFEKDDFLLTGVPLSSVVGGKNYRTLLKEYYDSENFVPTAKFKDYMAPMFKNLKDDSWYYDLIHNL